MVPVATPGSLKTSPSEPEEVFDDSRLKTVGKEAKSQYEMGGKQRIYLHRHSVRKRNHYIPSQLRSDRNTPVPEPPPAEATQCQTPSMLANAPSQRQAPSVFPPPKFTP